MKKIVFSIFLCLALSVCAFALDATEHSVSLSYDAENGLIKATVSVSKGNATVGHFGLKYNTQKLEATDKNFNALAGEIPDKTSDGKSYLTNVVSSLASYVVITPESNKPAELINTSEGRLLFGWYATKEVDAVKPEKDGGKIAEVYFKLRDDVTIEDISVSDFSPVSVSDCSGISGWNMGIIVINTDSVVYTYQSGSGSQQLKINMVSDFSGNAENQTGDGNTTDEQQPQQPSEPDNPADAQQPESTEQTDKTDEKEEDEENQDNKENKEETPSGESEKPESEYVPFKENGVIKNVDLRLSVKTFSDKLRIFWESPSEYKNEISEYRVKILDSNGNVVRYIKGITSITKSITIKELAPDFAFSVSVSAFLKDGTEIKHTQSPGVKTQVSTDGTLSVYDVTYYSGKGNMYGFDFEQVIFGYTPTKAPRVYAPEGYTFEGWTIDGENVIDLSKYNIYADTVFTAKYVKN